MYTEHETPNDQQGLWLMANNSNAVSFVGNLTRDCEVRFTPSGQAVGSLSVAVNRSRKNKQTDEWEEETSFFDVTCWGQLAEHVAESLTRGTRVVVIGRLEQQSWESKEGEKRSKVVVIADEVSPSLAFATATVKKIERSDGQGSSGSNRGQATASSFEPF